MLTICWNSHKVQPLRKLWEPTSLTSPRERICILFQTRRGAKAEKICKAGLVMNRAPGTCAMCLGDARAGITRRWTSRAPACPLAGAERRDQSSDQLANTTVPRPIC